MKSLAIAMLAGLLLTGGAGAETPAAQQIRSLIQEYAKSVDTLDLTLARKIWSGAPEVTFIHPRGTERGLQQILDGVYGRTMGTFSQRELLPAEPAIHVYGDTAWSEFAWTFHATVKETGVKVTTAGRETQIYHRENGAWKIVHVHYSGQPVTGALRGF